MPDQQIVVRIAGGRQYRIKHMPCGTPDSIRQIDCRIWRSRKKLVLRPLSLHLYLCCFSFPRLLGSAFIARIKGIQTMRQAGLAFSGPVQRFVSTFTVRALRTRLRSVSSGAAAVEFKPRSTQVGTAEKDEKASGFAHLFQTKSAHVITACVCGRW